MTLGTVSGSDSSSAVSFCSCCGAQIMPCFSGDPVVSKNQINQLISESFLTVKGAALFLPRGNSPTPNSAPRISQRRNKHTGDLQKHLQTMFTVLRPEDTIRLAVRLESAYPQVTRYMVVVSTNGRQDTEESIVLGMDFLSSDSCCTVGLVLPLWSDTLIHLDGDGGFSVSTVNRVHVFKPVSVQAMWSALQSLHKACEVARCHNYYPGSLFLTWVSYYQSRVSSRQVCINEWNAMQDVESHRANSPVLFTDLPTERERTERLIKMCLREIMMQKDLENVTCKEIRTELEMQMVCNLREFKEFIDNEMILILGQMDSPTEIFEHVFLGSEWNASNLEELQNSGVRYILNVTREIDNFFPGMFEYHNIRVYDEEATNLLEYWNDTYKFITKAKKAGAKCLVHCKMGVSRSASTVIAYAMKEYGWDLDTAFDFVKEKRAVTKPNPSFMKQLEEYQGILLASKQRHNKLWRSHSDSDLSDHPGLMCKPVSPSLGRSDSHNNNTTSTSPPSLHHFLGVAVLQALGAQPKAKSNNAHMSDSLLNGEVDSAALEEVRPPSPPLLRPHAATVVPEERLDNAASVAVAMPVALLHPPPSLHILPPTPELQRAHRGSLSPAANHEAAELSLTLLEKSSSEDVSPLTLESSDTDIFIYSLSDLTDDRDTPLSPETAPLPLWPSALPLVSSDYNNNPRTPPQTSGGEAVGSSNHSADSIDFFSAREKFLTLAKDRRTRTLSEQAQQRTPQSTDEETEANDEEDDHKGKMSQDSPQSEESSDQPPSHHHDNAVSVRHIITEIEAISHPASSLSPPPSLHLPVQADPPEELDSSHTPQDSSSPSMLPCDWPPGSVRRATEQLEQKLRQELEMAAVSQRSPLHSPNTEQPPLLLTPPSPSRAEPSPVVHKEQRAKFSSVSAEPKEKLLGSQTEPHRLQSSGPTNTSIHQVSGTLPVDVLMPENSHINKSHVSTRHLAESSVDTSTQSQRLPLLCSDLQTVGGVTEQELHTDSSLSDDESRLAPGPQELERIQQTLSELQAFLHESVAPGPLMDTMDSELVPPGLEGEQQLRGRLGGRSLMELTGYHRACELEARIRQAGLTPPSLMKRSASLAKLDCLELSANDLSDLDLRTYVRAPSQPSSPHLQDFYSQPQSHPDDIWKKQKVLTQINCVSQSSPSSLVCPKQDTPERGDAEGGGISVTSSTRQQVRGHPSRRSRRASTEKKLRAAAMLYNTM